MTSSRRLRSVLFLATAAVLLPACSSGKPKVGVIGDSITDLAQQPLHSALDSAYQVELVGHFGARADEVMAEAKVIAASKPDQAIVNIGTNDALQQVPTAQTRANIESMVSMLDSAKCIFLVEINEGITRAGAPRADAAHAINVALGEIARANKKVHVIAWNQQIAANGGNDVMTYDTVHLSTRGVVVLANTYRRSLRAC
ncbi:MAG: SGNH/GDSL hydrolase family protein [Acidimicrobiales bacterium]